MVFLLRQGKECSLCEGSQGISRISAFKGACLPMAGLDRLERTAAAGGGNKDRNMDRQDKQDRLVVHPVHPVYRCKTRIEGTTWIADEGC